MRFRPPNLDLFQHVQTEPTVEVKFKLDETEEDNFMRDRIWLHARKKIKVIHTFIIKAFHIVFLNINLITKFKHRTANLRLCQKPPAKFKDGTSAPDSMQELRITQYEQYIQEKLGLFRKPTTTELMLFNYQLDKLSNAF